MSEFKPLDPTACGLFMVAAISLPLAAAMLELNGANMLNYLTLFKMAGIVIGIGAIIAYRGENNFGFTTFMIVAVALYCTGAGAGEWAAILFGILFIVCAIWGAFIKAPWILFGILIVSAAIFILNGLAGGIIKDFDVGTFVGILALINFAACIYLGIALATEKLPAV